MLPGQTSWCLKICLYGIWCLQEQKMQVCTNSGRSPAHLRRSYCEQYSGSLAVYQRGSQKKDSTLMTTIDLNSPSFREKVYGCWLGKNCGGTLGAPLEEAWGRPELFDVWWYPKLQEGGIPNDDLEMQLIWLKALEEIGPDLKAADLAQYWLNHIGYNWDEYGLSKTNLRLGLLPPVSGVYNNWFKHCMGSPIRSEIWACVAPGVPSIAARFAYEDAVCDHAGGEGVFGSLFNAAVASAAFVVEDRQQLLDIGLSYIPDWSEDSEGDQSCPRGVCRWRRLANRARAGFASDPKSDCPIFSNQPGLPGHWLALRRRFRRCDLQGSQLRLRYRLYWSDFRELFGDSRWTI